MSTRPPIKPQEAATALGRALREHVDANQLGKVVDLPYGIQQRKEPIPQAGVLFVSKENLREDQEHLLDGPVDWVAEVLDADARSTIGDAVKLAEYASTGIPEYWLVDLKSHLIRVYVLGKDQAYHLASTYRSGQKARAVTIEGFEIDVDVVLSGG
jgi:Uma2 family endonuclease